MGTLRYRFMIIILMVLLAAFWIPGTVSSAGTETLISTGYHDSNLQAPSTWGDFVVWEDQSGGTGHIRLLNLMSGEERMISDPPSDAHAPRVQGTSVVWYETNTGGSDIYHYNITSGLTTRVTNYDAVKMYPVVYDSRIVWQELEAYDEFMGTFYYDLEMYDLNNPGQIINITPHPGVTPGVDDVTHEYPAIWGGYVVWQDMDDARYTLEIFMNDTTTGTMSQISDDGGAGSWKFRPAVSDTAVVWVDYRNGDADIFSESIPVSGNTDLTPFSPSVQDLPALSGNTVIWLDDRGHEGSHYQIGMNSLSAPSEVYPLSPGSRMPGTSDQAAPSVFKNRVVWRDDRVPGGYSEIYMYTDGVSATCPVAGFTQNISSGSPPLTVQFSDTTSPAPVYWFWDFGDGTNSTEQNPVHTYSASDTYPVTLTVGTPSCRNATGISTAHTISVGAKPVVGFTATPLEGMAPLTVSFTESSSGSPESWNWSFGDSTFSEEQNPSHTYTTAGRYSVTCNATNAFGTGTLTQAAYITVTAGAHEVAFTNITGITLQRQGTRQYLIYDPVLLPDYAMGPGGLALTSHPPPGYGWQSITFFSKDGSGFVSGPHNISGHISSTALTTRDILPAGFSSGTGSHARLNYQITLQGYQTPGSLTTDVWEGTTPADDTNLQIIYMRSNFASMKAAYTVNTTRNGLGTITRARINMSVGSGWEAGTEGIGWGRQHTYLIAMGYDSDGSLKGTVLPAHYIMTDTVHHLEYFEAEIPQEFTFLNKYALATLSGSGNPLQLITLSVTTHVSEPSQVTESSDSGTGSGYGTGAAQVVVPATATATPAPTPTPPDPGRSAKVYTNAGGVVTQATRLPSTDGRALITIGEGVVAKNAGGTSLAEITLKALAPENLPTVPPGSAFTFARMAYEIGPHGATFSPPASLTFTLPQAQWGQDYSVKSFDLKAGTWEDLPTTFNATTGLVTAQVSHLSAFALFTQPRAAPPSPVATPLPVPPAPLVKAQPPATAVSMFTGMLTWGADLVMHNAILLGVVIILATALYFAKQGRWPGSGR